METNWYKISQEKADDDDSELYKSQWESVNSSFIDSIAYYDLAKVLEIKLKNGNQYTFIKVPKSVYEDFKASPSKGQFFNKIIKKRFIAR